MVKDTLLVMDTLPQHVDDELRSDLNSLYKLWRERNPDGDIIDWLVELPELFMHLPAGSDADSETWRAWVDFWNWFTNQNRLVAADCAERRQGKWGM